jgi:hypothetical protein
MIYVIIPLGLQCVHTCYGQTLDTSSNVLYNMYILYNQGVHVWSACLAPLRRGQTSQSW